MASKSWDQSGPSFFSIYSSEYLHHLVPQKFIVRLKKCSQTFTFTQLGCVIAVRQKTRKGWKFYKDFFYFMMIHSKDKTWHHNSQTKVKCVQIFLTRKKKKNRCQMIKKKKKVGKAWSIFFPMRSASNKADKCAWSCIIYTFAFIIYSRFSCLFVSGLDTNAGHICCG